MSAVSSITVDPDPTAARLLPPAEMLARLDDGREYPCVVDHLTDEATAVVTFTAGRYAGLVMPVRRDCLRLDTATLDDGGSFPFWG